MDSSESKDMREMQDQRTVQFGRAIVIAIIAIVLFISALLISLKGETLNQDAIRWILTAGLFIAVYRGQNWARILSGVLLGLGAIIAGLGAFGVAGAAYLIVGMAILYGTSAVLLLFHPGVRAFLEHQRERYRDNAPPK